MPGYLIHLTEAKMICDILEKTDMVKKSPDNWMQDFFYGSILPDAAEKSAKGSSHFWNELHKGQIVMLPEISRFFDEYDVTLETPVLLGYLAHLHLDQEFWKNYMKGYVEFLDRNGKKEKYICNLKTVFLKKTQKYISPEDFFSKKYLYGDYTKLNSVLLNKYHLEVPVYDKKYHGIVKEVKNEDMEHMLEKLCIYIYDSKDTAGKLSVLSQDTLELFLMEAAENFLQCFLKGLEKR